jgi:short-subunit dehydrogenase
MRSELRWQIYHFGKIGKAGEKLPSENDEKRTCGMARTLAGRRILITGASSGIGRCLAEQAAQRGSRVILAARSGDKLQDLTVKLTAKGFAAVPVVADVTSSADRQHLIKIAQDQLGGLDVLINNAGVASFGHFADSTEEVLRQVMEVNFFAPAELIRLAIPLLRQGEQPAIVNISSMCGRRGLPAWVEYSASKFALCGLTEALRGEMTRFDIDVLLVLPGLTNTGLEQHLLRNEGRMKIDYSRGMPPEDVARSILGALQANRTETVLGSEARWILWINRFFPGLVNRLLVRKVGQLYAHS